MFRFAICYAERTGGDGMKKHSRLVLSVMVFLVVLLFAVPGSAETKTATAQIIVKAGETYYVKDNNISGNGITSNIFRITPQTAATRYDIVYVAKDSNGAIRERCFANYKGTITSQRIRGYIKTSQSANSGILLGVFVRKGSALLKVQSTGPDELALKPIKTSKSPIVGRTVRKNQKLKLTMRAGNTSYLPLVFGGTSGTKIRRPLSSTKYEEYTFMSAYLRCVTYTNGKQSSIRTYKYNSSYVMNAKSYRCVLIYLPLGSSRTSGWLKTMRGNACYQFPRSYLGIQYTLQAF